MTRFSQHWVHTQAITVPADRANHLLRSHNLLIKMIWSGFGRDRHANSAPSTGNWDSHDWRYMTDQLKDPANNRPINDKSNRGHDYKYCVMGDQRARSLYYDFHRRRVISRQSVNLPRGRAKPGKQTIKAGHYSLLPPHGLMTYCRGLDPTTGRTARAGVRHFDANTRTFPGFQLGWLFSADPNDNGVFKHCCETDMYGRRLPWLGSFSAVSSAMRNSPYSRSGRPNLLSVDKLRSRQNRPVSAPIEHNDCRFKATKQSVNGIVIPDDIHGAMGSLAVINAVHKKLFVLHELQINCPIYHKTPSSAQLSEVMPRDYWPILYQQRIGSSSAHYGQLLIGLDFKFLPIDEQAYQAMKASSGASDNSVLRFVLKSYGVDCRFDVRSLDDPECVWHHGVREGNKDAVYALIQCGANINNDNLLDYLIKHWTEFRHVFSANHKRRIVAAIISRQLIGSLTEDVVSLSDEMYQDIGLEYPGLKQCIDAILSKDIDLATLRLLEAVECDVHIQALFAIEQIQSVKQTAQALFHVVVTQSRLDAVKCIRMLMERSELSVPNDLRAMIERFVGQFNQHYNKTDRVRGFSFVRNLREIIQQEDMGKKDLTLMYPVLFSQACSDQLQSDEVSLLVDHALEQVQYECLTADQITMLLVHTYNMSRWSDYATLLADERVPVRQVSNRLIRFGALKQFNDLDRLLQQKLMQRLQRIYADTSKDMSDQQMGVIMSRMAAYNPDFIQRLCRQATKLTKREVRILSTKISVQHLASYSYLLSHFERDLLVRLVKFKGLHKALPILQGLISNLRIMCVPSVDGKLNLCGADYQALISQCAELQQFALPPIFSQVLDNLVRAMVRARPGNTALELGEPGLNRIASVPIKAMVTQFVDQRLNRQWRQTAYEYFASDKARLPQDQLSVRVYTTGALDQTLLMSLGRRSGYAMNARQCSQTKRRAICSSAQLLSASQDLVIPVNVATVVAPNLRRSPDYRNELEEVAFISKDRLNQQAYYEAMFTTWSLALKGLSEQARVDGVNSIVVTPLLGGGAYLAGQSTAVKQQAIRQNVQAMIDAYNANQFDNVPEIQLCIPMAIVSDDFDPYGYLQQIKNEFTTLKGGHLTLSQSDMFELIEQTQRSSEHQNCKIAIVNPSSDRVPGGGCYDDRSDRRRGYQPDRHAYCQFNQAAAINLTPMALEEQLGQVTDFMYSQCADMNPQFSTRQIIPVTVDKQNGVQIAQRSWPEHLRNVHVSYAMRSYISPARNRTVVLPTKRMPNPQLHHAYDLRDTTHDRNLEACAGLLRGVSRASSKWHSFTQGDKFFEIKDTLKHRSGLSKQQTKRFITELINVALDIRGGKEETSSGLKAVELLNDDYHNFASWIKSEIKLPHDQHLDYAHLRAFVAKHSVNCSRGHDAELQAVDLLSGHQPF